MPWHASCARRGSLNCLNDDVNGGGALPPMDLRMCVRTDEPETAKSDHGNGKTISYKNRLAQPFGGFCVSVLLVRGV
jgi:hypothetical protein